GLPGCLDSPEVRGLNLLRLFGAHDVSSPRREDAPEHGDISSFPMERKNHDCYVSQFRIPVRQKFRYLRFRCKKPSFAKIVNQAIYLPAWNPVGFQECEFVFKSLAFTHGYWRRLQALTKILGGSNNTP